MVPPPSLKYSVVHLFPVGLILQLRRWHFLQYNFIHFRACFLWWFGISPILPPFINLRAPQTQGFHLIFNFGTETFLSFSSPRLGKELRKCSQENSTIIFLKPHMSRFKNTYIYLFFRNSNNSKLTRYLLICWVTSWWTQHVFLEKERNLKYLSFTRDDLAQSLRGLGAFFS